MPSLALHDQSALFHALHATEPAPDHAPQMLLYGQFVGTWYGRLAYQDSDGVRRETSAEVHFGWVLEGRAVQDVWIAPSRHERGPAKRVLMYGTTLRVYDPESDLWTITWIDPVKQVFNRMIGRKIGDDIVQEFRTETQTVVQWMFTEITARSFHWICRESPIGGDAWKIRAEFFLRRHTTG